MTAGPSRFVAAMVASTILSPNLPGKRFLSLVAVDCHRRRGTVRMCCIDQYMIEWNAKFMLDAPGGLVEDVAVEHEDVAGDECDPGSLRIFDHHAVARSSPSCPVALRGPIPPPITIVSSAISRDAECASLELTGGRCGDHADRQA